MKSRRRWFKSTGADKGEWWRPVGTGARGLPRDWPPGVRVPPPAPGHASLAQWIEYRLVMPVVAGSNPVGSALGVAQRLERGPDMPGVAGSNPVIQTWKVDRVVMCRVANPKPG